MRITQQKVRQQTAAVCAAVAVAFTAVVAVAWDRADGAVGQVDKAYACFMPSGGPARVWAYTPPCVGGQVVSWNVGGVAPPTTNPPTTQPPVTNPPTAPTVPGASTVCPTRDQPSTYQGARLTVTQALQTAYDAGFRTVESLRWVVGIGTAESSLVTQTRNWHIEWGCRPASDVIGVQGPASVWNPAHTAQLHSDRGWLQWSSHYWPQYTDAQVDNPLIAAQLMFTHSANGTNFSLWDTANDGSAANARPSVATVTAFLATQ